MLSKHFALGLAAVGAALLLAGNARAVTLDTLAGTGGTVTSGNFVYSNFVYGGSLPAADIVLTPTATGVEFSTTTGGWTNIANNAVISYDVTVTGGSLDAVGLSFTATATGGAIASVGETVTDNTTATPTDYSLQVLTGTGTSADKSTDSVTLNSAATTLHVVKSIDIAANGGTASITLVDNTYTPTGGSTPGVPEPMSLALLPLAIAGLGLRKKLAR